MDRTPHQVYWLIQHSHIPVIVSVCFFFTWHFLPSKSKTLKCIKVSLIFVCIQFDICTFQLVHILITISFYKQSGIWLDTIYILWTARTLIKCYLYSSNNQGSDWLLFIFYKQSGFLLDWHYTYFLFVIFKQDNYFLF